MRIRIRTKLTAALALPLLGIVALAGGGVYLSMQDVDRAREQAALASRAAETPGADAETLEALERSARGEVDEANARARMLAVAGSAALVLTLLVGRLASRSIARPLQALRRQAEDMAEHRLPGAVREILETPANGDVLPPVLEPVSVRSRDEFREIADALNVVQQRALELAVEQAVLRRNINDSYVNLGRRNQNLLNRQIDLITDLEANETDPEDLDGLFRLDHLATRMRRNAESLLVLAGVDPPRRWSAPVGVADVIRAASSEVEDYQRVDASDLEPATLVGAAATDLAHVLAELLENALTFSPAEEPVTITGELTPSGYMLSIVDRGIGMKPDEIERSNRRLAGSEPFTVAPSRFVGHYVAGHLASRLGVSVALAAGPGGGTVARLTVPLRLVNQGGDAPARVAAAPSVATTGPAVDDALETAPAASAAIEVEPAVAEPAAAVEAEPVVEPAVAAPVDAPLEPAPMVLTPAAAVADEQSLATVLDMPAPASISEPVALPDLEWRDYAGPRHFAGKSKSRRARKAAPAPVAGVESRDVETRDVETAPAAELATLPDPVPSGFGGLAAVDAAADGTAAANTTPSGLVRRVPGAQQPGAGPMVTRGEPVAEEPERSTPEDVFAFLSSFTSGVERGRADAAQEGERR